MLVEKAPLVIRSKKKNLVKIEKKRTKKNMIKNKKNLMEVDIQFLF